MLAVLPESFDRPFAVPEGIALIALGVSLWRNPSDGPAPVGRTSSATSSASQVAGSPAGHAAVR